MHTAYHRELVSWIIKRGNFLDTVTQPTTGEATSSSSDCKASPHIVEHCYTFNESLSSIRETGEHFCAYVAEYLE